MMTRGPTEEKGSRLDIQMNLLCKKDTKHTLGNQGGM